MIKIDISSFFPLYVQIKTQIKKAIFLHDFCPNEPLPSIRELATRLVISPDTVARAYRELEPEGFIYTRKGKACFVSDNLTLFLEKKRQSVMNQILAWQLMRARNSVLIAIR